MKREIKFRCWDVQAENMFIPKQIPNDLIGTIPEDDDEQFFVHMQFTGLKDKNGIEIYEGDIIDTPKGICAITFDLGCFYAITVSRYRLGGWATNSIKVIGNIYESAELLNQKYGK